MHFMQCDIPLLISITIIAKIRDAHQFHIAEISITIGILSLTTYDEINNWNPIKLIIKLTILKIFVFIVILVLSLYSCITSSKFTFPYTQYSIVSLNSI